LINVLSAHGCKNFKKKLEKLAKKYPEIKSLTIRCSKALGTIIRTTNGNTALFMENIERKMNHYCNDHTLCPTPEQCDKIHVVVNAKAQEEFKVNLF